MQVDNAALVLRLVGTAGKSWPKGWVMLVTDPRLRAHQKLYSLPAATALTRPRSLNLLYYSIACLVWTTAAQGYGFATKAQGRIRKINAEASAASRRGDSAQPAGDLALKRLERKYGVDP